jgi:group I intron endonuclease
MYIYKLTNTTNNKAYIGATIHFANRMAQHKFETGRKNTPLYSAIKKYGWDSFNKEMIDYADTLSNLNYIEKKHIKLQKTRHPNGYNLTDGGDGGSWNTFVSEETREKMSQSSKETWKSAEFRKKNKAHTGKKHSQKTKNKMSENQMGSKNSMYGTVSPFRGKTHTKEAKEKNRQAHLGKLVGKNNPNSKLSQQDVDLIRFLLSYKINQKKIASFFNISKSTIWRINSNISWAS